MLSLVTVNYNDSATVVDYVNRILSFKSIDNIIIVDNNSTDDSFKYWLFTFYCGMADFCHPSFMSSNIPLSQSLDSAVSYRW